jgi:putative phage-type endonuclease
MKTLGHANVLADASDMSEEDWTDLRKNSIGSSDAASILEMGRYGSPLEVWEAKTGRHTKDMNFAMSLGHIMEPIILDLAADDLGIVIEKPNLVLQHPFFVDMTCNVDGVGTIGEWGDVVIEAKHAGAYLKGQLDRWSDSGHPEPRTATEGWWVQIQHQMAVTGLRHAFLAALCDKRFCCIPVPRDDGFIDKLETLIPVWFKRHVEGDIQPEFTRNDGPAVERMFPETDPDEEPKDVTEAAISLARARAIKEDMKSLKEELATCEVRVKAALGSSPQGFIDGECVITSKNVETRRVDTKKLKAEYPEVANACMKTTASRRYNY